MSNTKACLILLLAILLSSGLKAQEPIAIGEKHKIASKILNEDREVWIHLPKSYNDSAITPATYPVIYLLDAEINFEYVAPTVDYLSRSPFADMPECIVVGIKNTDRTRDFTPTRSSKKDPNNAAKTLFSNSGGSAVFLRFINEELKPYINENYRAAGYNILVGHSFGGLFAAYAFLQPEKSFDAYIANDPSLWWDNKTVVHLAEKITRHPNHTVFYLGQANNEEKNMLDSEMAHAIAEFRNTVEKHESLRWGYQFYDKDDHGTVSYPATYDGLRFIFNHYKTDIRLVAKEPASLIKAYKAYSDQAGFTFLPSETYLNKIIKFSKENNLQESRDYFLDLKSRLYQH